MKTNQFSIWAAALALAFSGATTAATITIVNADAAGEGFNDLTPVLPVGGNLGVTLGQQRLNVFQAAANQWGAVLNSAVPIRINAKFDPQTCDANGAVLGSAGPNSVAKGFTNTPPAPYNNTYFMIAEVNALAGSDLAAGVDDIGMTFNVSIDSGCLPGTTGWWYDTTGSLAIPADRIALMPVVFHEIAHGLGFLTITGTTGTYFGSGMDRQPDIWAHFLMDRNFSANGTTWLNLSAAQRGTSGTDDPFLVWSGANVTNAALGYMSPTAALIVNSPVGIAGTYDAQEASFGPLVPLGGVDGLVAAAVDTGTSTTDACEAITNGAQINGRIALVDRGTCNFTVKVANAQAVGAIGVIVANNVATGLPSMGGADPAVTIPSYGITQALGASIRTNLAGGVDVTLGYNFNKLGGMEGGYLRMYAPNPFESGSSRSHFSTTSTPNLLMEPALNQDLFSETDMTVPLFRDIFWPINEAAIANKAPTINAAAQFNVTLNTPSPLTEILVADVDAGTDPISVSFAVTSGTITLQAAAGVSLSGSGTATATITGARHVLMPYIVGGNVLFTTALNQSTDVPLTLTVDDGGNNGSGGALTDTANATIVVGPAGNTAPTITGPTNQTISEDAATAALAVTVGDTETAASSLTLTGTSNNTTLVPNNPANITFGGSGANRTVTITPAANQSGVATITLRVTDPGMLFTETTFTVTVNAVDDNPVAVADAATVNEDSGANTITVLTNDTDIDAGPKVVTLVGTATNGTTAVGPAGANVTYTPNGNYCGADSFTYTITGGSSATVSMTVTCFDDNPVAVADAATVNEDSGANTITVLTNDTDIDAGPKVVTLVGTATNGTTAVGPAGANVTYTPNGNYCGADSFTYTITGGSSATVSMTVTCFDDNPVAVADAATVNEDSGANTITVLTNDTDIDAGPKVVTLVGTATNGTTAVGPAGANVTYTPNGNYCGADSFTYTITGGSSATVSVTVTCINDVPSFIKGANQSVADNAGAQTVNPWATAISAGPNESQIVSFEITGNSAPGLFSVVPAVSASGVLTYTPAVGSSGTATITLRICDSGVPVQCSATQTFDIVVTLSTAVDFALTKSNGVDALVEGQTTVYTIVVSNNGNISGTAFVADTLPPGLASMTWTCAGTGCGQAGPVTGNIADNITLAAGASITYTVTAQVNGAVASTVANFASVEANSPPESGTNGDNSDTDSDPILDDDLFEDGFE